MGWKMKLKYYIIFGAIIILLIVGTYFIRPSVFVSDLFNGKELSLKAMYQGEYGNVSIIKQNPQWNIIKSTSEESQLTFWKESNDKKIELGWIPPNNNCAGWTEKYIYDENNNKVLDDKAKEIKLKCESAKCDGQNCYHISLTDAQAINIDDYIKLGENSFIIEYQNLSMLNYQLDWAEANITLYKNISNEWYNSIDDLFVFYNNESYKFGANDTIENETALNNYKYELVSNVLIIKEGNILYVQNPELKTIGSGINSFNYFDNHDFDFTDICSRGFEEWNETDEFNETITHYNKTANCEFSSYEENGLYYYEVTFLSDKNIDPIITISDSTWITTSLLTNVTAESGASNHTHLNISNTAPYDSLVGYWSADGDLADTALTTAYDWSGEGNDGTMVGNAVATSGGRYGKAFSFDGDGDYVSTGAITSLAGVNEFTISAWFRANVGQQEDEQYVFNDMSARYSTRTSLYYNRFAEVLTFAVYNSTGSVKIIATDTLTGNTWYHVVGRYNGTHINTFINGVKGADEDSITGGALNSNSYASAIGENAYNNYVGGESWNGSIDDVMIFNTSLTQEQITAIYNNQSARFLGSGKQELTIPTWNVSSAVYLQEFYVGPKDIVPSDVFFKPDGTKMYIMGYSGKTVDEYNLSTAWNVATATYLQEISVATKETEPMGVFFKPDGTKMYTIGMVGDSVDEYNLSTAWNVTSAVYLQEISVATKEIQPAGLFFKPDGLKMYTIGYTGDSVDEYNLGTAWNVSSAVYLQEFYVGAKEISPSGVFFKPDGTKMYTVGVNGDTVDEYNLGTAWSVTTASYLQEFSVNAEESGPTGVFFKSDGTKMYIIGTNEESVDEYNLPSPIIGNNKVNVSTTISNLLNSKVNLTVGYYDGTWHSTAPQTITSLTNHTFEISDTSTELTLNYTFTAGDYSFTSPIITGDINYEVWNEGGEESTSFTVSLPIGYTEINFSANSKDVSNLNAEGQNETNSVITITNTGDVNLDIYFKTNQTNENIDLIANNNNNSAEGKIINTTLYKLISGLASSSESLIWMWVNWTSQTPATKNTQLNISVNQT